MNFIFDTKVPNMDLFLECFLQSKEKCILRNKNECLILHEIWYSINHVLLWKQTNYTKEFHLILRVHLESNNSDS